MPQHRRPFFSQLGALERGIIRLNLVYLAAIAFMPFPTALVGKYEDYAITVIIYAITLAAASFIETAMYARAQQQELFRRPVPTDVFRYGVVASLVPVVAFVVSIPIAFVDPTLALLSWLIVWPAETVVDRLKPASTDDVFD
jgi:uncharacterized membrane protein